MLAIELTVRMERPTVASDAAQSQKQINGILQLVYCTSPKTYDSTNRSLIE